MKKSKYRFKKDMTYCLSCKDYTDSIGPKKGTMTNKVIREKSRYTECVSDKARLKKKNQKEKLVEITLILNFPYTNHYKTC